MRRIVDLNMDRHLQLLAAKILALGCNPKTRHVNTQRKVQSGIFLTQLLDQKERTGQTNTATLPGYHYGWHNGPLSESLREDWQKLQNALSVYGNLDLEFVPHRQKYCVQVSKPIHVAPNKKLSQSGCWAQTLSTRAYLHAADWDRTEAREEMKTTNYVDAEYFKEAEIILRKLNLL